jgi:succinate-semialdehyde dehydrogenase / glutarate-semialdehyde dehydrogenase
MKLSNKSLFQTGAYINGEWVNTAKTYDVINPSTLKNIAKVSYCDANECNAAIKSAHDSFVNFKKSSFKERSDILLKIASLMLEHKNDLAIIMTTEQGKPLSEALGEVAYAASFFSWFSEEAKRLSGDILQSNVPNSTILVQREPVGVVAAITPWNFPLAMLARKAGAAIAAGCTLVCKPSEETPLSANALCVISQMAGLPAGVINIISGNAAEIGSTIMQAPNVKKITFTGSTKTGKILLHGAADTVKRVSMELGGNAPFIVFADADIDKAIDGAMASKFRNAGQTCISVNRFYIHQDVYDEFTNKLAVKIKMLKVGDGFAESVNIGPLINDAAIEKITAHIDDAITKGATLVCGGKNLGGRFFEPTLLTNMQQNMKIAREETFGPVAACFKFKTTEEVISMANDTEFGLAAYFYSTDLNRVFTFADNLEYGMVGINETMISNVHAPFGGIKESGFGREGSSYGIDDYLNLKYKYLNYAN